MTNDGLYWDGWYVFDWVKSHNWIQLHHFYDSLGLPLFGWIYRLFAFAPFLISTFMWATVISFFVTGALTYRLALDLSGLTRAEALVISLLSVAIPVFTAAQEFIMFPFIFTHTLFLLSAWFISKALKADGFRHIFLRALGLIGFVLSFSNAALLVYYGGFYVLFFFGYRRSIQESLVSSAWRFVSRFPDLLLLPPAAWYARSVFTPQFGWYAQYNEPQLAQLPANLETFFRFVPSYTLKTSVTWIVAHPFLVAAMIGAGLLWYFCSPVRCTFKRSSISTIHFVWIGALLLVLAVIPFAAAGKAFWPTPIGEISRHCILAPLPAAILVFAVLRAALTWRADMTSRVVPPLVAFLLVVFGVQYTPVYLLERAEWIHSRALLYHAVRNEEVGKSSVIFVHSRHSVFKEIVYGLYGFKIAFGSLDRFVTNRTPANGLFFTALEIEARLESTSMLPREYRNINRTGRQIVLEVTSKGGTTDWQTVRQYLSILYWGTKEEMDNFLASLCTLGTRPLPSP